MKNKSLTLCLVCILVFSCLFYGCREENQSGGTIDEPAITVDYLTGEYADQLLRDGAEHVFGSISMDLSDPANPVLNVTAKEYVEDSSRAAGYYIADRNLTLSYPLAEEARTTFLVGRTSIPKIMTTEEFCKAYTADTSGFATVPSANSAGGTVAANATNVDDEALQTAESDLETHLQSKYYDIYVMNGQVELILAYYL
ncbi:MAG: hypothetical protein K6F52_03490 [Clostridia bacterium]|nr:hypothetical protein [Clostridia bacterium]